MRRRRHAGDDGYTLIEMLGAVLLMIAIGGMVYAAPRPSPQREAGDTGMRMRAMLTAALAASELDGGDVVVRAEGVKGELGGRFLALAGPAGVVAESDPGADWIELEGGVVWRAGTATTDPMGIATDGSVPGTVRCTSTSCETGRADYVVYFVGHQRSPRVSWGLVLTRERDVHLLHWNAQTNQWESEQ